MLERIKKRNMRPETKQDESRRNAPKKLKQFFPYTKAIVYSTTYVAAGMSPGDKLDDGFSDIKALETFELDGQDDEIQDGNVSAGDKKEIQINEYAQPATNNYPLYEEKNKQRSKTPGEGAQKRFFNLRQKNR